jgi:DNA modification methylase
VSEESALSEFVARHAKPYDPTTDSYDRPPFASDIKEGKNDPIYNAHSYHTKVPPRGIIPYILHYTEPGDLILDPFCGSGMTGVAAQMCANPPADILEQFPELKDRVGPRACILNDLSPAACHIAYNYNTPVDVEALKREFERIKADVKEEFDRLYGTEHYEPAVGVYDPSNPDVASRLKNPPSGASPLTLLGEAERTWELLPKAEVEMRLGYPVTELPRDRRGGDIDVASVEQWICIPAMMEFTVWSDTHRCEGFTTLQEVYVTGNGKSITRRKRVARGCGKEINLWDVAVEPKTRRVLPVFACKYCGQEWKKGDIPRLRSVPVLIRYEFEDTRGRAVTHERPITRRETELIKEVDAAEVGDWYPQRPWDSGREMWRGGHRDAGINTTADFYTPRSLGALARFWSLALQAQDARIRKALQFVLTSISLSYAKTTRYNFGKRGNCGISGTLYVASFTVENALPRIVGNKWPDVLVAFEAAAKRNSDCFVSCGSAAALTGVPDSSVDYIFTDPPFGSNLFYGDCSFLWESWLDELTDLKQEAVWNKSVTTEEGGKTLEDYGRLMAAAFAEMFRILKPGRWATVEFNNSDGRVFIAIKHAVLDAGFEIVNMLLLDKAQKSFKQTKGATGEEEVVDKDVVFNLRKPAGTRTETPVDDRDLEQQVAEAVRQHLHALPDRIKADPLKYSDEYRSTAAINSILINKLIPNGVSVERLNLPFIERVCARYFRKIGQRWYLRGEAVGGNADQGLFEGEVNIVDEVSAIVWLRQKLRLRPMLIGELKPLWMRATGLLPTEISQSFILEDLLAENFWRDPDTNRWREPTDEERERMNDDRSLRVLHDAERFIGGSLRRGTTDGERCEWIDVLFKACKAVEEKEPGAMPVLRGFDEQKGYVLISRLFQSVLKDNVEPGVFQKAEKQARVSSQRLNKAPERKQEKVETSEGKDRAPTLFD